MSRLRFDLSVNSTTRALDALRRRGIDVIDLTISNPTHVGLHYPEDLLTSLASPRALDYNPHPLGLRTAREAVVSDFERRRINVDVARIGLTASTSEAYAWLFKLLCDAGDNVLVPRPSYPLFDHLTGLESVTARPYRLEYHGSWRIDLDHLHASIDDRTRAVLIVSPNNPTGSFVHADDLSTIDRLCAARNIAIIGDEVFADFALLDAPQAPSVMSAPQAVVFSLGGLSKTIGLPQVKLGWIAFGGPSATLDPVMAAYELIADTYLSVSTPVQTALPDLLSRGEAIRAQIQSRLKRNLSALRTMVGATPSVSLLNVEGGWSAILQVPAYRSEEALVLELLTADHVLVHPGFFYDFEREAFVVISLLAAPEHFDRAVPRVLARASQASSPS